MAAKGVNMAAGSGDEPEMTVAQLAAEQAEQRKMLRALQKATLKHFKECGSLQVVTAGKLGELADGQLALTSGLHLIEARFELFDKICHWLIKNGKKLGYTTVSAIIAAYVGLLAQSWALHKETTLHAEDAANKASAASSAIQRIPDQTVQRLEAARAVTPN